MNGEACGVYPYRHGEPVWWAEFKRMAAAASYEGRLSELMTEILSDWMRRRTAGGNVQDYLSATLYGWAERYAAQRKQSPQDFIKEAVRRRACTVSTSVFTARNRLRVFCTTWRRRLSRSCSVCPRR